jgi:hypothetical protein
MNDFPFLSSRPSDASASREPGSIVPRPDGFVGTLSLPTSPGFAALARDDSYVE